MKASIKFLSMAILGGVLTLIGYKYFLENPQIIERTVTHPTSTYEPIVNVVDDRGAFPSYAPTNFTEAAEKTLNTVVHVKNTAVKSGVRSWEDLFFGQSRKYEQVGTGSGVIISSDGYIVTNNHVIAEATSIEVTLNNKKKYEATLVGADKKNDIALLKISSEETLPYIPFSNSDNVRVGEWVLAVGNPYNLTSTVTAGIVSAKGRDLEGNSATDSFIQTDAAVNPGNSGGALVNTRGELIGINTAISSRTGAYVGYSFAVPSNIARKIVDDLLEFGSVQEAVIGFVPELKDDVEGVIIKEISEESNADKSGLKNGDIIKKINNVKITKFSDLTGQLTAKRPGEVVNVTVDRNGSSLTKSVKLIKRIERIISRALNVELKDLSKKEKKSLKVSGGAKIIREARNDYDSSESIVGYTIVRVNGENVSNAKEARNLIDGLAQKRYRIKLEMMNTDGELVSFYIR